MRATAALARITALRAPRLGALLLRAALACAAARSSALATSTSSRPRRGLLGRGVRVLGRRALSLRRHGACVLGQGASGEVRRGFVRRRGRGRAADLEPLRHVREQPLGHALLVERVGARAATERSAATRRHSAAVTCGAAPPQTSRSSATRGGDSQWSGRRLPTWHAKPSLRTSGSCCVGSGSGRLGMRSSLSGLARTPRAARRVNGRALRLALLLARGVLRGDGRLLLLVQRPRGRRHLVFGGLGGVARSRVLRRERGLELARLERRLRDASSLVGRNWWGACTG